MDGLGKYKRGLTLLELLIAIILFTTVVLTASAFLSSFKNFYLDFMAKQGLVEEISLSTLEEITAKLMISNSAVITDGSSVAIRIDESNTPSDFSDDTVHTYWKDTDLIKYKRKISVNPEEVERIIAKNVVNLNFELQPAADPAGNRVKITIGVLPPKGAQQNFETTVVLRCRSAQAL